MRAARNLLAAGVLSTSSAAWYIWRIEPAWLSVERLTLRLPRLPRSWDGVTLAQLSDLHFFLRENKLRHPPATVNTPTFVSIRLLRAHSCPPVCVNSSSFVLIRVHPFVSIRG
ncbi:MAG: hypothetical protein RMK99_10010 [Anaerolineales bacterium]|nr:hypothetical protein [Anaerolineales bacterium]